MQNQWISYAKEVKIVFLINFQIFNRKYFPISQDRPDRLYKIHFHCEQLAYNFGNLIKLDTYGLLYKYEEKFYFISSNQNNPLVTVKKKIGFSIT